MGRVVSNSGQTVLHLAPMQTEVGLIKSRPANVRVATAHVRAVEEHLRSLDRWATLLACICRESVGPISLAAPPPALAGVGQLLFLGRRPM